MSSHSSIVGGSTAARLLACPGSHQALMSLPPTADAPSEYAEEGTAMHEVMTDLMRWRQMSADDIVDMPAIAADYLGAKFYDRILTQEHLDTMIVPALEQLFELENQYGGGFRVVGVEERVRFPGVPGAFGTCDLILQSPTCVLHVDLKFGQGIGVKAVYHVGEDELLNAQLAFYVAAAMATRPELYPGRELVGAIIQPRGMDPLTHASIYRSELLTFQEDIEQAVMAAIDRDPVRHKGEHCRFAACKVTCPLWTGPLLDLSALTTAPEPDKQVERKVTAYAEYLAQAKALVDELSMFKSAIDEQLHAYLEAGGAVPGWRLKAKVKQRQWIDPAIVAKALKKLGFKSDQIWRKQLQTFAATDATAKKLGKKIPEALRLAPPTNETTIAPEGDPAPVVNRQLLLEQFQASLAELQKEVVR